MPRLLFALVLGSLWASISFAKPLPPVLKDRKPDPPEQLTVAPVVKLPSYTNWGYVEQTGKTFIIHGNPCWTASGAIQADGRIQIQWFSSSGETAPSVYTLDGDGGLVGQWGYSNECEILGNGNIVGDTRPDQLRPMTPPKAEGPDL